MLPRQRLLHLSLCSYVEWSFHEPEERQYSFSGDRDVAQFVRAAAAEGLYVLFRPGPYVCAERDLVRTQHIKIIFSTITKRN